MLKTNNYAKPNIWETAEARDIVDKVGWKGPCASLLLQLCDPTRDRQLHAVCGGKIHVGGLVCMSTTPIRVPATLFARALRQPRRGQLALYIIYHFSYWYVTWDVFGKSRHDIFPKKCLPISLSLWCFRTSIKFVSCNMVPLAGLVVFRLKCTT